jgi:AraC-like DNA-binding protein
MRDGAEPAEDPWGGLPRRDRRYQRVGAFTALPSLIRELGADPVALLQCVGLTPDPFERADGRVPYDALLRLLDEAAEHTRCPHFGLLAGRMCRGLADLGLVGEVVRHSATMGEALQSFTVHQYLNSGGGLAFLLSHGTMVEFGYAVYHPAVARTRQAYDCALAVAFNVLRELGGPGWAPSEVLLPHGRRTETSQYRNFFKAPLRFNAEVCAVRFASRWMERPVEGADRVRRQRALSLVEEAADVDLIEQVVRALRVELLRGKNSGDDVARALAMHRRTLNRRLQVGGTTFQRVLDAVRFEVARQLLGDSEMSLDDVAATLGYAGISSFMRTFRRWTGTTPARWRRAASYRQPPDAGMSAFSVGHAVPTTGLLPTL